MRSDIDPAKMDGGDVADTLSLGTSGRAGAIRPPSKRASRIGLGTKFSIAAAVLLLSTLAGAIGIVTWRSNQIAERSIREDLHRVPLIYSTYQSDLETHARDVVRSLAGEPGTIALFDPAVSIGTRYDFVTGEAAAILRAKTVFLFDADSRLLARSDKPDLQWLGRPYGVVKWVSEPLATRHGTSAVIVEGTILSVVGASPVISGGGQMAHLDGVLAASFPLDANNARALQGLTRGEVSFLVNRARADAPPDVIVSTATDGFHSVPFTKAFKQIPGATDDVFTKGAISGPFDLTIAGSHRIGIAVPIKSATGETYGAFVVTRDVADEMAAFEEIRLTLLGVGVLAVLIATPIAFGLGRRIAGPLQQLASGAAGIREGDLDVALPPGGGDEVGILAHAFRGMLVELREKRALEQLVAALRRSPTSSPPLPRQGFATPVIREGGPRVGDVFAARYRIRSVLGSGATGTVFLAEDLRLEEDVALKVLQPRALSSEAATVIEYLKTEIKLARRITHPNVVRVHDLGEVEGEHFLTMEYVPGMTLHHILARQHALDLGPGLQICKQLWRGLAAVHAGGLIHRDIKPQNIMVLPNGLVKLMDFGIARIEKHVDPDTGEGEVVGTPSYMSPEQAMGQTVDRRSDIYAVGAVMFEIFTGKQPFLGSPLAVIRQQIYEEPPKPSRLRPELPANLEGLILACLAKEPVRRPASAEEPYSALMGMEVPRS
ncbi:MAG: protein kinase [Acidobacteria bacterium]|nr:protein kinase [Acidobacteriota bacterium]